MHTSDAVWKFRVMFYSHILDAYTNCLYDGLDRSKAKEVYLQSLDDYKTCKDCTIAFEHYAIVTLTEKTLPL